MNTNACDDFTDQARRLLEARGPWREGEVRDNPVTGFCFAHGLDPIAPQIRDAVRALRAQDQFACENPDLPPLPLSPADWGAAKGGRDKLLHALALFTRSLATWDYDLDAHPSFSDYLRGLLCSPHMRMVLHPLADDYPPKPLAGLTSGKSTVERPRRRRNGRRLVM